MLRQRVFRKYFLLVYCRHEVNADGKNRWYKDGLNSLNYNIDRVVENPLYTKWIVKLLDADPYQ